MIRHLLVDVATHLCGRPVDVQLRAPEWPYQYGSFTREGQKAVIEIDPALWDTDREKFLLVFLHETAHALDFSSFDPGEAGPARRQQPGLLARAVLGLRVGLMETKADLQALEWRKWAQKRAVGQTVLARLLALLNYQR